MTLDIKVLAIFLPFLGAALYGLTYACNEKVFASLSISTYTILYSFIAIGLAVMIHVCTPEKIDFSVLAHKSILQLSLLTMITSMAAWMITLWCIKNLSANYTSITEISYPFFTIFFGYAIFSRQINWSMVVGGVFIVIGSAIVITGKTKGGG